MKTQVPKFPKSSGKSSRTENTLLGCHMCGQSPQSCPTLCNPMDYSPPDSSVHGILQARILEWVAISFSRESSRPRDGTHVSCITGGCFTADHQRSPNQHVFFFFFLIWIPKGSIFSNKEMQNSHSLYSRNDVKKAD